MSNWLKIIMAAGTFVTWAEKACADGKIDSNEVMELVSSVLSILGVRAEINLK